MRLARFIAMAGIASRRKAEELIRRGFVQVNDIPVTDPASKVDPHRDKVYVDGEKAAIPERFTYYALNKPKGFVTSRDPQGHRSVFELVPLRPPVHAAGRLDADSEGLLVLSDDGSLIDLLVHPRYEVPKVYRVRADGELTPAKLERLHRGIRLSEGKARGHFGVVKKGRDFAVLEVTITQGMNRQIRRMLAKVGLKVRALKRIRVGPLNLGRMATGKWRRLEEAEVAALRKRAMKAGH